MEQALERVPRSRDPRVLRATVEPREFRVSCVDHHRGSPITPWGLYYLLS